MQTSTLRTALLLLLLFAGAAKVLAEPVWIDVHSAAEHRVKHIEGDPRISHTEIVAQVSQLFPDKTTEIHLYCAAGVRAAKAKRALEAAGYTQVSNAGGIDDAISARGL